MELKPGYKQTEVGVIPEDWDVVLLDSVARRGSGHTPDKAHPEYWGGDIKWVSLADSQRLDNLYITETSTTITPEGISNSSANLLPAGSCIVTRDAGVGKSAILAEPMAVSQHFMAWHCGPRLSNHYLYFLLQAMKPELERIAIGNTIKTIGLPYFKALRIQLPSLEEQNLIASALTDIDQLIRELERSIAKKQGVKQATMQELLTGKRRLPGFEGEWEVTTFEKAVRHHAGNSALIKGKLFSSEATGLFPAYSASGQDVWCNHFDHEGEAIVVSAVGSRCGKAFIAAGKWCAIANTHVVWPKQEKINGKFLGYLINNEDFWLKSGTGQPFVLFSKSFARPLRLPALPEQSAISTVLSDIEVELSNLEALRDKTHNLKQGMMQQLLTGKIRLT